MDEQPPKSGDAVCPSCDAECGSTSQSCWLCGASLDRSARPKGVASKSSGNAQPSKEDHLALLLTVAVMSVVVIGVFAAAPGLGAVLGVVVALATVALGRASGFGKQANASVKPSKPEPEESNVQSAIAVQNRALKIGLAIFGSLAAMLGTILAVLLTLIIVLIMSVVSIISAFIGFFQSCFELFQPPG